MTTANCSPETPMNRRASMIHRARTIRTMACPVGLQVYAVAAAPAARTRADDYQYVHTQSGATRRRHGRRPRQRHRPVLTTRPTAYKAGRSCPKATAPHSPTIARATACSSASATCTRCDRVGDGARLRTPGRNTLAPSRPGQPLRSARETGATTRRHTL